MNKMKDYIYLSLEEGVDVWRDTQLIEQIKKHSPYYESKIYLVSKSGYLLKDEGTCLAQSFITTKLDEQFYKSPTPYLEYALATFVDHVTQNTVADNISRPLIEAINDSTDTYYLACDLTCTFPHIEKTRSIAYFVQAISEYAALAPHILPCCDLKAGE